MANHESTYVINLILERFTLEPIFTKKLHNNIAFNYHLNSSADHISYKSQIFFITYSSTWNGCFLHWWL